LVGISQHSGQTGCIMLGYIVHLLETFHTALVWPITQNLLCHTMWMYKGNHQHLGPRRPSSYLGMFGWT